MLRRRRARDSLLAEDARESFAGCANVMGQIVSLSATLSTEQRQRRAKVTNNLFRALGVDGRSPEARRARDVLRALVDEFGPADELRLRELLSLRLSHEQLQRRVAAGDAEALDALVRTSNVIARVERDLRRRKAARAAMTPQPNSLQSIIARHQREAAEKAAAAPPASDSDNDGGR